MTQSDRTRRDVIAALTAAVSVSATQKVWAQPRAPVSVTNDLSPPTGDVHDFDFLVGSWTVRHRFLKKRLVGSTDWIEFNGTLVFWQILGGFGNVDDNVLAFPSGVRRAISLRTFNATTRLWSIWWIQASDVTIDSPMHGGFKDGLGVFYGDDVAAGKPIKLRFHWSHITPRSAKWEQAISIDGGATWEDNWFMDFTRVA